jgi:hypothetical protein
MTLAGPDPPRREIQKLRLALAQIIEELTAAWQELMKREPGTR